jgi:hypothetical protein
MNKFLKVSFVLVLAGLLAAGCNRAGSPSAPTAAIPGTSPKEKLLLSAEPSGAKGVLELRKEAIDGAEVVMVGRVGGSKKPFVEGRAAFTIVDTSIATCKDKADDNCDTPWDYCCSPQDELAHGTAMVKFVDEQGKTLQQDAQTVLGVQPLQTVVVRGQAKRDADGNLTVLASGLFIR